MNIEFVGRLRRAAPTFLIFAGMSWAAPPDMAGTAGASFLKIPVGPRAGALAGAYAAAADDVTALYWNPAGLARLAGPEAFLAHTVWFESLQHQAAAVAAPVKKAGVFGVSFTRLAWGDIEGRDVNDIATSSFTAADLAVGVGYARAFGNLAVGAAVTWLRETIENEKAQTAAGDLGVQYRVGDRLRLGAAAQHLGGKLTFVKDGAPLPLTVRAGGAWEAIRSRDGRRTLTGVLDLSKPSDGRVRMHIGAEGRVAFARDFVVQPRVGYALPFGGAGDLGGFSGLGAGAGLGYRWVTVHYALEPFGALGLTHRLALTVALGGASAVPRVGAASSPPAGEGDLKVAPTLTTAQVEARKKFFFSEGQEAFKRGQYDQAIASWEEVLKLDPNDEPSKSGIARAKAAKPSP